MKFNTGFYNEGEIEMKRIIIFKKYMQKDFWIDIISIISINIENIISFNIDN